MSRGLAEDLLYGAVVKPSFASVDRSDNSLVGTCTCGDLRTQVAKDYYE